jgi:hypothetical protein
MDTPLRLALALGAGYMMEIDDNIFLTPEVSFRLPFSNVSDFNGGTNNDWNFAQLRAGVSLTFGLGGDEVVPEQESSINVGLKDIRAYDKDGMAYSVDNIRVEEVKYTELFPIVPYVNSLQHLLKLLLQRKKLVNS